MSCQIATVARLVRGVLTTLALAAMIRGLSERGIRPCPPWPLFNPPQAQGHVGFTIRLGPIPTATAAADRVAMVRPGVCWCDIEAILGERLIYSTHRVTPTSREITAHYPSVVVTVGADGRVTEVLPPP